jgi:hypothetical protein
MGPDETRSFHDTDEVGRALIQAANGESAPLAAISGDYVAGLLLGDGAYHPYAHKVMEFCVTLLLAGRVGMVRSMSLLTGVDDSVLRRCYDRLLGRERFPALEAGVGLLGLDRESIDGVLRKGVRYDGLTLLKGTGLDFISSCCEKCPPSSGVAKDILLLVGKTKGEDALPWFFLLKHVTSRRSLSFIERLFARRGQQEFLTRMRAAYGISSSLTTQRGTAASSNDVAGMVSLLQQERVSAADLQALFLVALRHGAYAVATVLARQLKFALPEPDVLWVAIASLGKGAKNASCKPGALLQWATEEPRVIPVGLFSFAHLFSGKAIMATTSAMPLASGLALELCCADAVAASDKRKVIHRALGASTSSSHPSIRALFGTGAPFRSLLSKDDFAAAVSRRDRDSDIRALKAALFPVEP